MGPNLSLSGRGNSVNKNALFNVQLLGYTIIDSVSKQLNAFLLFLLVALLTPTAFSQNPNTSYEITNIAQVSQILWGGDIKTTPSNPVTVKVSARTPSQIELMQFAPQLSEAHLMTVEPTGFDNTGNGDFSTLSAPTIFGTPINLDDLVPLAQTNTYHMNEPVFIRLTDLDQNFNPELAESIVVTITTNSPLDVEILRLEETGPNTGIFTGFIQSTTTSLRLFDGVLTVHEGIEITATYTDNLDRFDIATARAVVDPFGVVFNSITGELVDGVGITIVDAETGLPADVFGDDGISTFPSTVFTGESAEDSSGFMYLFPTGSYRFPFLEPGDYRLEITPPIGLSTPSVVETEKLQALSNGPFNIVPGSRGESFTINPGPSARIDIPADPTTADIFVRKSASKQWVGIGEFVQYLVEIENPDKEQTAIGVTATDVLPRDFRYRTESTLLNGQVIDEPQIADDGRTLQFVIGDLGPGAVATLSYVVEVGAGAPFGDAINAVYATTITGVMSNVSRATVEVIDDLLQSQTIIVGRVTAEAYESPEDEENEVEADSENEGTDPPEESPEGVPGIRIYLEDGSYTITDENGMYHFDNVTPGVHVVQVDVETLPDKYEPSEGWNDRFAQRSYSQFVDLQAGSMWRADFSVRIKPVPKGHVSLQLTSERKNGGNTQTYTIKLEGNVVPITNLRVMAMMPNNATYIGESCSVNEEVVAPENNANFLTWRLENDDADWEKSICFKADVKEAKVDEMMKVMVMFDTPTATNQRMPIIEILASSPYAYSGVETVETTGKLNEMEDNKITANDDEPVNPSAEFDEEWLESAEVGTEWLYPSETYLPPIASLKVGIKHDPKHKVTLLLEDVEVSPLNFERMDKNSAKTVAVSHWRGIDLKEGDNHFVAIIIDTNGDEIARLERAVHYSSPPVKAEFVPEQSKLVADGKSMPEIAIRLTDKDGYAARRGIIGEYVVDAPYEAAEDFKSFQEKRLAEVNNERHTYVVGRDGIAILKLNPTSISGEATVRLNLTSGDKEINVWLEPALRDWILVGLSEGTFGYNVVNAHMDDLVPGDVEENFYKDGRVAFFAKGKVKGKWLLTLAYDSDKEKDEERLFNEINPDTRYTLYGDATQQEYEAPSSRSIYVKIERDKYYALFGDMETNMTVTELSKYSRSLNGFKTEYRGDRFDLNAFASDTNLIFIKDEIRGDGTSGLYRLSRKNIVVNSEKITLETRDRLRSEVILSTRALTRYIDYNIDYHDGTLYFKEPVFSRDAALNPIFIVVDYESNATQNKSYNYGGRGAVKFRDDAVEIGSSFIHEEQGEKSADLYGVDATYKVTTNTEITAEYAQTNSETSSNSSSGSAYLAEIVQDTERFFGKLYFREQDKDFGLGQQNSSQKGTRKFGVETRYKLKEDLTLNGLAFREENLDEDATRNAIEVNTEYNLDRYSLRTGFIKANDKLADGTENASNQVSTGASVLLFDKRLNLRVDHHQSLGSSNDSVDFPTRTILGSDYILNDSLSFFGEHEITDGDNADANNSRIGFKSTPWNGGSVDSSLEQKLNENGARLFAILGLAQKWQINERWSLDAGLDQSRTIKSPESSPFDSDVPSISLSDNDFVALSLGTTYQRKKWAWNSRVEQRSSDTDDKWGLSSGIVGELHEGLTMSLDTQLNQSEVEAGFEKLDLNVTYGLAYRPLANDNLILLNRLDYYVDKEDNTEHVFETSRIVDLMNANYQPNDRLQFSLKLGTKYVLDTFDNAQYNGLINLVGLESRLDITKRWDLGIRFNMLHNWQSQTAEYSFGPSVGFNIVKNTWVGVGYNFGGFYDADFSRSSYTTHGVFFQFRIKFDQTSVKEALEFFRR